MSTDEQVREVQNLLSQYVGQLTHGCGNPACLEPLCHTGSQNTSQRPTRKWTPRSARAIALAIVGGSSPRKHLCQIHLTGDFKAEYLAAALERDQSQRDPSSFEQLLCDTPSIRKLCSNDEPIPGKPCLYGALALYLDSLIETSKLQSDASRFPSNKEAATLVSTTIHVCLGDVPHGPIAQYSFADSWVREGSAFPHSSSQVPADSRWNIWLTILDSFDRGPPNRTMAKVAQAVAVRTKLEQDVDDLRAQLGVDVPVTTHSTTESSSDNPGPCRQLKRRKLLGEVIEQLNGMTDLPAAAALVIWMKKLFLLHWDGGAMVKHGSIAMGCLLLVEAMSQMWPDQALRTGFLLLPAVASRLDVVDVAQTWMQHRNSRNESRHLLSFDFLFDSKTRALYFRAVNHLKMRHAHSGAERAAALRRRMVPQTVVAEPDGPLKYAEEHYLLVYVSRTNVLQDAYDQLWQRRTGQLHRPLRVRLGEVEELEIGHDLGGVQIEFFNLICKEIFAEDAQMFITNTVTGLSYFRPGSLQPLYMFELFGLLVALAIYNGITIPVSFPLVFYKALLHGLEVDSESATLETMEGDGDPPQQHGQKDQEASSDVQLSDLEDGWPDERKALQYILDTSGAEDDVEYTFPLEANGLRLFVAGYGGRISDGRLALKVWKATPTTYPAPASLEIDNLKWPGWHVVSAPAGSGPPAISSETKSQYVVEYACWLTFDAVAPQWDAFIKGFARLVDHHSISLFAPAGLKNFVEGSTRLDIRELCRATRYDGYEAKSKYIHTFWRVVTSWPEEKQKQLLKFVTAAERIPIGGASNITFVIQKTFSDNVDALPTSSTCFGTLMLPKYPNAEVLDKKLSLAIKYGMEGFGTG